MIKRILIFISTLYSSCFLLGQEGSDLSFFQSQIAGLNGESIRVNGLIEDVMPFDLLYVPHDTLCNGIIRYGNDEAIHVEGTCSDTAITLYEFDDRARVSGVISGNVEQGAYTLTWANHNHSLKYYISAREGGPRNEEIAIYNVKDEEDFDHLLLYKDYHKVFVSSEGPSTLRWMEYECPHAPYACTILKESSVNQGLSLSDQKVSIGSRLFQLSERIQVRDKSKHEFSYFYNFRHPYLNDKKFDSFIEQKVTEYISQFEFEISDKGADEDQNIELRFKNRALGDFFLMLVSPDLISGYLTFHSSTQPTIMTTSFIYNRQKDSFIDLRKIWEKDFDFAFFLRKNIEQKKRALLKGEEAIIKKMLKEDKFQHFGISSRGIVFYTDFSFMYGRRQILIPFDEIEHYINEKAITNLLK